MSSVRAGAAYVELLLKDGSFTKGLNAAGGKLKSFGKGVAMIGGGIAAAGASVIAPLVLMAQQFADAGSAVDDMSQRTGMSAEAVSTLGYAAKMSGSDMETLEKGIVGMQKNFQSLAEGAKGATEDFGKLGLSFDDLNGKSVEDQFKTIAEAISKVDDPSERAALAMRVLGKSGAALLPMMADGAAGIDNLQSEADSLNLGFSTEDAKSAAALGDAQDRVTKSLMGLAMTIGSAVAPLLTDLFNLTSGVIAGAIDWAKNNKELILTVFKVAAAVAAGGVALVAIGGAIIGVGAVLTGLGAILGAVGSAFAMMGTVVAAILSPVGLLVAGVAALGGYLVYASGAGTQAMDFLMKSFSALKDEALASFGAIANALASGDIAAAGDVMWAYLKLQWVRGTAFLQDTWQGFKDYIAGTANVISYAIAGSFFEASAAIAKGWNSSIDFMANSWSIFAMGVKSVWNSTVGFLKKAWVSLKSLIDSDINVEAEVSAIDANTTEANRKNWNATATNVSEREAARAKKAEEINAQRDELKKTLNGMQATDTDARKKKSQAAIDARAAEVAKAKEALDAANARGMATKNNGVQDAQEIHKPKPLEVEIPEIPEVDLTPDAQKSIDGFGAGVDKDLVEVTAGFDTLGLGGFGSKAKSLGVGQLGAAIAAAPVAIAKAAPMDALVRDGAGGMPADVKRAIIDTAVAAKELVTRAARGRLVFG